jgi:hypothetical protein
MVEIVTKAPMGHESCDCQTKLVVPLRKLNANAIIAMLPGCTTIIKLVLQRKLSSLDTISMMI